jgi:hypothetical protein
VEEEEVDLAARRERAQDREVAGRDPRQAEERDALREVDERGVGLQSSACLLDSFGGARLANVLPQAAPELGLPRGLAREFDLAARPAAHHLRAVERVAVEQLGEVAERGEPAGAAVGVVGIAEVEASRASHGSRATRRRLEQRPYRALREPRVGVGIDARRGRDRVPASRARRGELDVRADAVGAAGARAEARGHPLA